MGTRPADHLKQRLAKLEQRIAKAHALRAGLAEGSPAAAVIDSQLAQITAARDALLGAEPSRSAKGAAP
jgi:hypothetical protein